MPVRAPFLRVVLEGQDVTEWVTAASVTEDDQRADQLALTIPDPRMAFSDCLFEGSEAEVDMGWAEPGGHARMIRAIITKVEIGYAAGGVPSVTLKGSDRSIRMGYRERKKKWSGLRLTDIVREIGAQNGFTVEARIDPDPVIESKPLHQDGKTDLAFLQETARRYKAKCFLELDEAGREILYFLPERDVLAARRVDRLPLRWRQGSDSNLTSFSAKFDVGFVDRRKALSDLDDEGADIDQRSEPPADVEIWPLDPARVAAASPADQARIAALYAAGVARKQAFQTELAARRETSGAVRRDPVEVSRANRPEPTRSLGQSGSGETFGTIWLRAKSIVDVQGCAVRDSGDWYVNSVTHAVGGRGFTSSFTCVR